MSIHRICARVHIGPDKTPKWTAEQVYKIVRRSPVFERQIHRLLLYEEFMWRIDLGKDDGFDFLATESLLNNLGKPNEVGDLTEVDENGNLKKFEEFSTHCSALWYFQVAPSISHVHWRAADIGIEVITQNIRRKPLPPPRTPDSGRSVSIFPITSAGQSNAWCWNCQPSHPSRETSLNLANIALVVGRTDVFETELKTVIWNWPEQTLAVTKTPVERLKDDGEDGLISRRKEERAQIIKWFDEYIARQPRIPTIVKNYHKMQHGLTDPPSESIYELIKSFQLQFSTLLGTNRVDQNGADNEGQSNQAMASQNVTKASGNRNVLRSDTGKGFNTLAVKMSHWARDKTLVEDMFKAAHTFIDKRQGIVAGELIQWRNEEVARWAKTLLTERDLPEMPNVMSGSSSGARTQNGGSSTREDSSERTMPTPID